MGVSEVFLMSTIDLWSALVMFSDHDRDELETNA